MTVYQTHNGMCLVVLVNLWAHVGSWKPGLYFDHWALC